MPADLSDFQALFDQNLGRQVIITFSSGKNVSGKVKAVTASFVELENPNVYVSYVHIGYVEFSKSHPDGWNRFPSES
jgi:hypothetical protein